MLPEVMDITKICRYFPNDISDSIHRDSFIDTINQLFEEYPVVVVEGNDGIGKTTLLAQFCQNHIESSFPIFIKPITRSSYNPDEIKLELLNEVNWVLTKSEIQNVSEINLVSEWIAKKFTLQKHARKSKITYYFIIDGLSDIPDSDSKYRELILELLPFGESEQFKFLISGDINKLPISILSRVQYKPFPLSGFTLPEAYDYFLDLGMDQKLINELYRITKSPGQFASFRRIINTGKNASEVLEDLPSAIPNFFDIEWAQIDTKNIAVMDILSLLTFSKIDLSINDIEKLTQLSASDIRIIVNNISFIQFQKEQDHPGFVNEPIRKSASIKLSNRKESAENRIIEYLRTNRDDSRSLQNLPELYNQTKNYDELINFLTKDNLLKLVNIDESLINVRDDALLGVTASANLNRDGDLLGFGIQAASLNAIINSNILESEIDALISIKHPNAALQIVEKASTKEAKLHLLSAYINACQKNQIPITQEIDRVKFLYNQVEPTNLGELSIEIAANLINVLPDIAFELVEKSVDIHSGENALDWAFTKLSIKALEKNETDFVDILERIQKRITDPSFKSYSSKLSLLFTSMSADSIINGVEKIEKVSERLFILRQWLLKNRDDKDVTDVIEYGLNLAIKTTDYAPNARDYRELATPLPGVKNVEKIQKLINILNSQKDTIERLGPIEDYVRLLLLLARAENSIDKEICRIRLVEIYLYISYIEDKSTQSACYARLLTILKLIDPEGLFEVSDNLHTLSTSGLEENLNELISCSAEQFVATRGILRALAKSSPEKSIELAKKLNTLDRRDSGIHYILTSYLDQPDEKINSKFLKDCLAEISGSKKSEEALLDILTRIEIMEGSYISTHKEFLYFISLISKISRFQIKCNANCLAVSLLSKSGVEITDTKIQNIITELKTDWNSIDICWEKVDIGYRIVEAISSFDLAAANQMFLLVEEYRRSECLDTESLAINVIMLVRLSIRAFSGLIKNGFDKEDDLQRLKSIIEIIPSYAEKVSLYTDLSLRYLLSERNLEFKAIISNHIRPLLNNLKQDTFSYQLAVIDAAPALYSCHSPSAIQTINELPSDVRDEAYTNISTYIFTKTTKSDPYYDPLHNYKVKLSYEEIMDLLLITQEMVHDSSAYAILHQICDVLSQRDIAISSQQKAEISRSIDEIINKLFPKKGFISHDGYKVLAQAQLNRIKHNVGMPAWEKLVSSARSIPNDSDKALVLAYISTCIPRKFDELRKNTLESSAEIIAKLTLVNDRMDRYEVLSRQALEIDQGLARKYINLGFSLASKENSQDAYSIQRRLIDYAYKIDSTLAASLASVIDDDPVRLRVKNNVSSRLSVLQLRDKIVNNNDESKKIEKSADIYQTAWLMLGSLFSERVSPCHFDKLREFAQMGANDSLTKSYSVFAWVIQNGIIRYSGTKEAHDYLRPIFEATINSCEIIPAILRKSSNKPVFLNPPEASVPSYFQSVIPENDSDSAKKQLVTWLSANLGSFLYIADPYFGPEDLWIFCEILKINPQCEVKVLTSLKHHKDRVEEPWMSTYTDMWKLNLSDQDPPDNEIVIVGTKNGLLSPIHDRWWVSDHSGIQIGTSLGTFGITRISSISELSHEKLDDYYQNISKFLIHREKLFNSEKLLYMSITF